MKLRKLCAVLLAASLGLSASFAPACNIGGSSEEHKHSYSQEWTSDGTGHWHASTCGHDVTSGFAAHTDADGDFVCDVCGYVIHTHTYETVWSSDAQNHWYAATCGHDVVSGKAAHSDGDGDGKCDACGYIMAEAPEHTHTFESGWTSDETGHWHAATCDHDVTSDFAAHTDSDGDFVCDICGYVIHTHTFAEAWTSDETGHWHASTCGHDVTSGFSAHTDADDDFVCDVCDYVIHTHTFAGAWTSDETGHWHAATCGHDVTSGFAAHTDSDGDFVCDVCDYVIHTHTFAGAWTSDGTGHWHAATCGHDEISGFAAHTDADDDGKCDICRYNVGTGGEQTLVTYFYIGQECAAFEWTTSSASSATVQYRLSTASGYTSVDEELIRQIDANTARVDIVGLKGGNVYDFKIISDGVTYIKSGVTVSSYDRSGYAHFGYSSGVGAYNDDGTAKSGARIVYVTEATKNTVELKVGTKTYTGIVSILQNAAKDGTPLIVRIIGTVGAATWNEIPYNPAGDKLTAEEVIGANGKQLPTDRKDITQAELIAGGYNTLNTSVYSELIGLSSKATYSDGEYDSAWNNCIIQSSSNITIEGIGEDARIFQWGLTFKDCSSVEVRNITFEDYTEDACSVEAGDTSASTVADFKFGRIWLHHNTFEEGINYWDICAEQDKHEGDGATDFKGIANVTVSYNEYHNNHKTGLVGGSNAHTTANLTYHHNYYNECYSRMPLARQANIHIYNNYYYGSTGTNMSLRASAYAFIENCYFDNAKNPIVSEGDSTNGYGYAKILGCVFDGKTIDGKYADKLVVVTDREQTVANTTKFGQNFDTDSTLFYYDEANKCSDVENMLTAEEVKEQVPLLAGVMKHSGATGGDIGGSTSGGDEGGDEGGTTTPPSGGDEGGEEVTSFTLTAANCGIDEGGALTALENELFSVSANSKYTVTALTEAGGGTTATADDNSGLSFTSVFKPSGASQVITVTAKKAITLTVYYTVSDSQFNNKEQSKSGYLKWTIDGAEAGADTNQANKNGRTAYAVEITVESGQVLVLSASSNRLIIFGLVANAES